MESISSKLSDEIDALKKLRLKTLHASKNLNFPLLTSNPGHAVGVNNTYPSVLSESHVLALEKSMSLLHAHSALLLNEACCPSHKHKSAAKTSFKKRDCDVEGCIERLLEIKQTGSTMARVVMTSFPGLSFIAVTPDPLPSYMKQIALTDAASCEGLISPHQNPRSPDAPVSSDNDNDVAWRDTDDQFIVDDQSYEEEFLQGVSPLINHALVLHPPTKIQKLMECPVMIRPSIRPLQRPTVLPRPSVLPSRRSPSKDEIEDEIEDEPAKPDVPVNVVTKGIPVILKKRPLVSIDSISGSEDHDNEPQQLQPQLQSNETCIFSFQDLDTCSAHPDFNLRQTRNYRTTFNPETLLAPATNFSDELLIHDEDRFLEALLGDQFIPRATCSLPLNPDFFDVELDSMDDEDYAALDAAVAKHILSTHPGNPQSPLTLPASDVKETPALSDVAPLIDDDSSDADIDMSMPSCQSPEADSSVPHGPTVQVLEEDTLMEVEHNDEFFLLEKDLPECEIFSLSSASDPVPEGDDMIHSGNEIEAHQSEAIGTSAEMSIENHDTSAVQKRIIQEIQSMKKSILGNKGKALISTFLSVYLASRCTFKEIMTRSTSELPGIPPNQIFVSLLMQINNQGIRLESRADPWVDPELEKYRVDDA